MDDFLYNLRRETDKRNRRQGGQQQYRGPDRRGGKDQRRGFTRRNDASAEMLPEIKTLLETISENQKKLVANEKRKTLALENIAASLRLMSGNTEPIEMPEEEDVPAASASAGQPADATSGDASETVHDAVDESDESDDYEADDDEADDDEADDDEADDDEADDDEAPARSSREEIRKIALELRDQGKTYKEIAQYLDDEKIPTFSGKGGWHAPTIHKLCK